MNKVFCTIVTSSHLFKALALKENVASFGGELIILVVDHEVKNESKFILSLDKIPEKLVEVVKKKYLRNSDEFRWAMKPIFLLFLIEKFDEVYYCDVDLFFVSNPITEIKIPFNKGVLITPHFYPFFPDDKPSLFEANFRIGLFNAGFIGVNKQAKPNLLWWKACCEYQMKRSYFRGLFDDQKYLDAMPIIFDNVEVSRTRGFNLAEWNMTDLKVNKEMVLSNGDKLTFLHMTDKTIYLMSKSGGEWSIISSNYLSLLKKYNPKYKLKFNRFSKREFGFFLWYVKWKFSQYLIR
jgi:hypothetical protein